MHNSIFHWLPVGTPAEDAKAIKDAGFNAVILHSVNVWGWEKEKAALVDACKAVGLMVYGSCAVYGDRPGEGAKAGDIAKRYKLRGWVFDAESAWDAQPNAEENTKRLFYDLEKEDEDLLIFWCWWMMYESTKGNTWHPKSVLAAAAPLADIFMPMVYWGNDAAISAVWSLENSLSQWRRYAKDGIYQPIGRAYNGDGGTATPEAMKAFAQKAAELGCYGVSWWEFSKAYRAPAIWSALKEINGAPDVEPEPEPEPEPKSTVTVKARVLNMRETPQVTADNSNLVGQVFAGAEFDVLETQQRDSETWYKVAGWIAGEYHGAVHAS